jgi:hypothetical protein
MGGVKLTFPIHATGASVCTVAGALVSAAAGVLFVAILYVSENICLLFFVFNFHNAKVRVFTIQDFQTT